jgi:microcystin-dependent protein
MAETPPYFYYPFAIDGDVAAIPVTTQPSGSISYQQGYGPDYELDLLTNPDALPIGRTTMNQLFFDITTLLQQYSQYGTPLFITTAQNQGVPFPYPQYARTYYTDGNVYENQVDDNIVAPGVDNSWLKISGDATGVLTGTILDYAGFTAPAGYLTCDGSAVARATYGALLSVISQTQTGTTTNTLDTVSGLTSTAQMYVGMPLESANFPSGTTVASIVDSTNITASATATASGAVSIQFFNWGNGDGSTTFNVPNLPRHTTVGQGGTGTAELGNIVGQSGGEESHMQSQDEVGPHVHVPPAGSDAYVTSFTTSTGLAAGGIPSGDVGLTGLNQYSVSQTAFNVIQPSVITYKIIKT